MILLIAFAILLDAAFGDPIWLPHPVLLIGRLICALEKRLRMWAERRGDRDVWGRRDSRRDVRTSPTGRDDRRRDVRTSPTSIRLRVAGFWLCALVVLFSSLAAYLLALIHPLIALYLLYAALAARCLSDEAKGVQKTLGEGIEAARARIARLVGRETDKLSEEQIIKAAVETVAENTADGAVSPLFYMFLGALPALLTRFAVWPSGLTAPFAALSLGHGWLLGLPCGLAWAFKAASTLDSMVGYKNERYIDLGRFSAKLDDVLNYIPARLTGSLICVCAPVFGLSGKGAFRVMRRDHKKHPSPNSAWSESAAAGALGVQLGGGAYYGGVFVEKETLGDAFRAPEPADIKRAVKLLWGAYGLAALFGFALLIGFM